MQAAQTTCPQHFVGGRTYSHTEYIVPGEIECSWGGIGTLGGYAPNGVPSTPLSGGTTHVKGSGAGVRAHEVRRKAPAVCEIGLMGAYSTRAPVGQMRARRARARAGIMRRCA